MTEASEDGNYLVRVRAQVMTRDDSSGGWVPLGGGGLSNVSVRRRAITVGNQLGSTNVTNLSTATIINAPSANANSAQSTTSININNQSHGSSGTSPPVAPKRIFEYLIFGKRITDQSVVLSCTIKKDFEYNKVMPTFHHWRTGEKKFGLTFQTAADARAFDKGVRTAVEELLEDLAESALINDRTGIIEDDVFMTLNLPVESNDQRTSSDSCYKLGRRINYHSQCSNPVDSQKSINYRDEPPVKILPPHHPLETVADTTSDNYPYVQLTTLNHEYLYPVIDDHKGERLDRRNSLKKPDIIISQPTKTTTGKRNLRFRCKHCQELYCEQDNPRGSCEFAPDPIKRGIATVSCLSCAQCMLYHCMSDAEGDFAQNPCSTEEGCGRRWCGLTLLSLIVPCLWIYPPLRAVHLCGMSCGVCGGRHHPME